MDFTHIDKNGNVNMVDVSGKNITLRIARAHGKIKMKKETLKAIVSGKIIKGNVLTTAKIAGIMGAKRTSELIPMCHNIFISKIDIEFKINDNNIEIFSLAKTHSQTGIEMEALTAVNIAALTIYDMCKAIDREMEISDIYLIEKSGGKSGHFLREDNL
ncbi:molybdenum cofactor biosynthesis protein C [Marinitoga sp. 1197]|uniref:cyclic pyranopterin monophosphate synthase MoaC n=1 Tax=unclassified Marinitoga TaxID=2640159 RepID=UPI00064144FD|nr:MULTISPECIES: cyclic pyranopterin monophosphate synthase MoaC [unclassified Marinitoga]KLO22241.1 molybdenum cofactor biosynthesis protein C [Marinitoga sp. 1155]KLO23801.1 molybdenum cofactor biosynthesis protein C [Marinitoga sp. 1197]NUV00190.1 molybdenum cofactor biosynthesis protein C [Marinitoga sp. 1154]